MKKQARLVIIGAGIVGCSTAYHLAQLGWRDILVVDQGPLFATGGATTHSAGLISQVHADPMMGRLARYTVDLLRRLGHDGDEQPYYHAVGSIEVAQSKARMTELQRRQRWAARLGLPARLLTPAEVKEYIPGLNEQVILGGLFVNDDGYARAWESAGKLAELAAADGAVTFQGHLKVTDLRHHKGRVDGIITQKGTINCDQVLLCTNVWAPIFANRMGLTLPLRPVEHQYVITRPLPPAPPQPVLYLRDYGLYFRRHGAAYGVGSFYHEPHVIAAHDIGLDAMRPFLLEDFIPAQRVANELLPGLAEHWYESRFNGLTACTIDGYPILGPSLVEGLWLAAGVSISHAGGAGRAVAEWLANGVPWLDLHAANSGRFQAVQQTPEYIQLGCTDQYRRQLTIEHPREPRQFARSLRLAPFHERLVARQGVFFDRAGWEVAGWYEANERLLGTFGGRIPARSEWAGRHWSPIAGAEHLAARAFVGLFDLSHLTRLEVAGPGAAAFLDQVTTNTLPAIGGSRRTLLLNPAGGIEAQATLARLADDRFWLISCASGSLLNAWLRWLQPGGGAVSIQDLSASMTALGLWGAAAGAVLDKAAADNVSTAAFAADSTRAINIGFVPARALRHALIGEPGWLLFCGSDMGSRLWDTLWMAGQAQQLIAAGTTAFESLRIENGCRRWGVDLTGEHTPAAAGLSNLVDMTKGDFLGRDALLAAGDRPAQLCRLELAPTPCLPLGGEPVFDDAGSCLGHLTSAEYGYGAGKGIAYAYLPPAAAVPGARLHVAGEVEIPAIVVAEDPPQPTAGFS